MRKWKPRSPGQHNSDTFVKLSREFAELEPVIESIRAYRAASRELNELQALLDDPATDPEMRELAQSEKGPLHEAPRTTHAGSPPRARAEGRDG